MYRLYKIIIKNNNYIFYNITKNDLRYIKYNINKYFKSGSTRPLKSNLRYVLNKYNYKDIEVLLIKNYITKNEAIEALYNILNNKSDNTILNNINTTFINEIERTIKKIK